MIPPLILSRAEIDEGLALLDTVLAKVSASA
jgi:4-aminobutyrate aminotransferase-like enzyme